MPGPTPTPSAASAPPISLSTTALFGSASCPPPPATAVPLSHSSSSSMAADSSSSRRRRRPTMPSAAALPATSPPSSFPSTTDSRPSTASLPRTRTGRTCYGGSTATRPAPGSRRRPTLRGCSSPGTEPAGTSPITSLSAEAVGDAVRPAYRAGVDPTLLWRGGEDGFGGTPKRCSHRIIVRTDLMWKAFLLHGLGRDHPASNVWGPKSEVEMAGVEYPATLVVVVGMDPLQERQRRYTGWLKEKGKEVRLVEYENAIHAFYVLPELPETPLLLAELKAFVLKQQDANGY